MKATLSYDLFEERYELFLALTGHRWYRVVEDFDNYLRAEIKYKDHPEEKEALFQEIRDKLWSIREEEGVLSPEEY